MKYYEVVLTALGVIGAGVAELLGGWDAAVHTLVVFMLLDYVLGFIVAGVFKKSPKTDTGALDSKICWKGLFKKFGTLILVVIAVCLEKLTNSTFIKSAVCIALISNELLSLTENLGVMGVPIPKVITNAVDLLKKKGGGGND